MQFCPQCSRTYPMEYKVCPLHNVPLEGRQELDVGMIVREKYKILELIGSGAMGRVWLVEDLDFTYAKVRKAMKVPLPELAGDPAYMQRFRDEAAKAGVLNHPNIVRTEHIDRTESGLPFLLMELIEGRSLRWWMEREPQLKWPHCVEIAREIAAALEAAHQAGLVHCDIKPENVLAVTKIGPYPLKVTDFGLAKATSALTGASTQVLGRGTTWGNDVVAGTPTYISPEQALSRGNVGPASDVYSLGVVLFELLSGAPPFGRTDSVEDARRAHEGPAPPVRAAGGLPAGLADLVAEMLARDANLRPSAGAVAARLKAFAEMSVTAGEAPLAAGPPSVAAPIQATSVSAATWGMEASRAPSSVPAAAPREASVRPATALPQIPVEAAKPQKPWLIIGVVGVGVLGVAVMGYGFLSRGHQPEQLQASASASPAPVSIPAVVPEVGGSDNTPASAQPVTSLPGSELTPGGGSPATNPAAKKTPASHPPPSSSQPAPEAAPATPTAADAEALDRLGMNQLRGGDRAGALQSFRKAADLVNTHSMVMLGTMYSEQHEYNDAAQIFLKAARLGDARGMYYIGVLYEGGKGVPMNLETAVQWYQKADQSGDQLAEFRLGTMYERGVGGLPRDLERAKGLYQKAGTAEAKQRLAVISPR